MPSAARRAATQLMPGQYSRGPPVTKAQRGKPSLVAREAGTGGGSSEEAEVIWTTGTLVGLLSPFQILGVHTREHAHFRSTELLERLFRAIVYSTNYTMTSPNHLGWFGALLRQLVRVS